MANFAESEMIHSSELQENHDQATRKFLRREYARLVETKEEQSEKIVSMTAMLRELQQTLSQLSNQLGIRQIAAESSQGRVDAKLRRMSRTAITPQESISSPATIPETIPSDKFSNQQVDEISGAKKESKKEVDLSLGMITSQLKLPNTKVHVSDSENLRNIETRIENSVLDNFETVVKEAKIQKNIGMDVVNGDVERIQRVMSISKNVSARQVLDTMCQLKRLQPKNKKKLSLSLKTWMFKFKYKPERRRSRKRHNQDGLYTLSRRVSRKNKSAKLQIFSKHKLHNQLFALVADNIHTLPRKPATSSSMLPLYVYQMGVSDIQDNDKEMVADPVTQAIRNLVTNAARFGFITVLSQTHVVHLDVHLELSETSASTSLYGYCLPTTRSWPYHRKILIREIVGYGADVVCLQDVQIGHFEDFLAPELKKHGYECCCYMKRNKMVLSGNPRTIDGCATFFKQNKFSLVQTYAVDYNKSAQALIDASNNKPFASKRLITNNIVLIAVLEAKFGDPSGKLICVANTRFDVQTDLKDVMLWQVHTLLNGLEVIAKSCKHLVPIIKCGDFNRVPVSWLGVVCVLTECMMHKVIVNSAKLPETLRGRELVADSGLQAVLDPIIRRNDVWEAYTQIIGKLQIKLKQGLDLPGASWHCSEVPSNVSFMFVTWLWCHHSGLGQHVHILPVAEQKSFSIWHRWRRKGCTRTSSCVLPLPFSFFKLEDKLVLRGESIDTIHHTYFRKNKQVPAQHGDVAESLAQDEVSGR